MSSTLLPFVQICITLVPVGSPIGSSPLLAGTKRKGCQQKTRKHPHPSRLVVELSRRLKLRNNPYVDREDHVVLSTYN